MLLDSSSHDLMVLFATIPSWPVLTLISFFHETENFQLER